MKCIDGAQKGASRDEGESQWKTSTCLHVEKLNEFHAARTLISLFMYEDVTILK